MSLLGFEPRTPSSLRMNLRDYNPNELHSYKTGALDLAELQAPKTVVLLVFKPIIVFLPM